MIGQTTSNSLQDIQEAQKQLFELNYNYWIDEVLFSFNWWILIILMVVPWFLWWRFVDKKRLVEIALMGILVIITAVTIDTIGVSFLLWSYSYDIIQMIPFLIPIDFVIVPICYMVVYQHFQQWKSYLFTLAIVAAVGAFIIEPLFMWRDIYISYSWKHIYSFFAYITMGIILKLLIQKMIARQVKANTHNHE